MRGELSEAVTITVDDHRTDLESLWDWLRREPELRGQLRSGTPVAPDGTMGSGVELVVLASAPALDALTRSIPDWLSQRKAGVTVRVTAPDGSSASLTADDASELLRDLFGNR